jgi:hypothetical protein
MPINNMKKTLISLLVLFCAVQLFAQRQMDPKMIEVIKSKKVAFITENVGLTPKESEKFWPVYNQLEKERYALMDRRRELEDKDDDKTVKNDEYYRKLANEIVAIPLKESKLMEEYNAKFMAILPAEKVVKLYRAERKFRSYLMHEMRKNDNDSDKDKDKVQDKTTK